MAVAIFQTYIPFTTQDLRQIPQESTLLNCQGREIKYSPDLRTAIGLFNFEEIDLTNAAFNRQILNIFLVYQNPEKLFLDFTNIKDEDLECINTNYDFFTTVSLKGCNRLTNLCLPYFDKLENCTINLTHTNVTKEAIEDFHKSHPSVTILHERSIMKKRANAISTAVLLLGLAFLAFYKIWWPGILLIVGIALCVRSFLQKQYGEFLANLFIFGGLYLFFQFPKLVPSEHILPLILAGLGVIILIKELFTKGKK